MRTESGKFATNTNSEQTKPENGDDDSSTPFILTANWADSQDDFDKPQYQYLTNTVYENYSMYLMSHGQASMGAKQFRECLRLLYTAQLGDAAPEREAGVGTTKIKKERGSLESRGDSMSQDIDTPAASDTASNRNAYSSNIETKRVRFAQPEGNSIPNVQSEMKTSMPQDIGTPAAAATESNQNAYNSNMKIEKETENSENGDSTLNMNSNASSALPDAVVAGQPTHPAPATTSRETMYREQSAELKHLVSTLLYLTEMYGVAQTRGGAQVSQYRRTLTAQSHTILVQRLARRLQETEMGFWAWLARFNTTTTTAAAGAS